MKDEDPKPGVVIDVTPDREADVSDAPPVRPAGRIGSRGSMLALALVTLLLVAATAAFGYRYWAELARDIAATDARVHDVLSQQQQLRQALNSATEALRAQESSLDEQRDLLARQRLAVDEARSAFQQQEQRLADENLRLQEREAELRAAVADVHSRVGRSGTQWMIAEAEYLLRIATDRLILARDTQTAQVALQLADQRLRDTGDPGWTGVREQIARDIARLSSFPAPDSAGLSARLAALIGQIPQLRIAHATIGPERTLPEHQPRAPGERSWNTLLDDLWSGFKDSVRIRERDTPVQAMLAPEHQFFLYENLKLHLEAARLGLARADQALFRDNLDIAADWLAQYFEPSDPVAAALGKAIGEMRGIEIRPEMPDISQSLRALEVRQRLVQGVATGGLETP